jgi:glutathionylspermidine synthase
VKRIAVRCRPNLDARVRETDFRFHEIDGETYWDESGYYAFSLQEIENDLEAPTGELAALCLEAAGRIVTDERHLKRLAIPEHAWDLILESWRRKDPSLYGRFDLAYEGTKPAKLLEYNADTPTALFEASVFQWIWLEDALAQELLPAGCDQFNSIHERLVRRLREVRSTIASSNQLHLACMRTSIEDRGFISYLEDCAVQAGFETRVLDMGDIGTWDGGPFVDLENARIEVLFKLYPWEWMFADPFGKSPSLFETRFIEPPWKTVLSNKGILPLLWEMAPRHPNLLPAYFEDQPERRELNGNYVRKPLYSREGENIVLVASGKARERTSGSYGREGCIWQQLAPLPGFDGRYPVVGSWVVGSEPCGIGIREDTSPITKNTSRFVPHAILPS